MIDVPATFDRDRIPAMAFLRVLPAEQRGVFHSLMDALKTAREAVFRVGGQPLTDEQIAQMACEQPDVLARVLPHLEKTHFVLRDADGALYSPHLVERQVKRAERALARAEREQRRLEFEARQTAGEFASDASLKTMTSRQNAAFAGRPRKGESKEQARERKEREVHEQREMRLLTPIAGGHNVHSGNQNQFSKVNLISGIQGGNSISGFPEDIGSKNKNIIPNPDSSENSEIENAETPIQISDAEISQVAADVLKVSNLPPRQTNFAKGICGQFLRSGVPGDLIVDAVRHHTAKMSENGDKPEKMIVFKSAIERFWVDHQAGLVTGTEAESAPLALWEQDALEALGSAQKLFNGILKENRDWGAANRAWPEVAAQHGLPSCEVTREAYLGWYRQRQTAA